MSESISLPQANAIIAEQFTQQENKYFLLEHFVIAFGYNTAAFLGYLLNKHFYYFRTNQMVSHHLKGDGWFYLTIESGIDQLHLSRDEQDVCIRKLKKLNLLEVVTMGKPPKRYFRLNIIEIAKLLLDEDVSSYLRKTHKSEKNHICGKPTNQNQVLFAENPQIRPIYNKLLENKKEYAPSGDDAQTCVSSSKSEDKKIKRADGVFVSDSEHQKLIKKFGSEEIVLEGYQELSEWKASALPNQVKKHASDYLRLRKWAIPDLIERNTKLKKLVNGHEKNGNDSKLVEKRREEAQRFISKNKAKCDAMRVIDRGDYVAIGYDDLYYGDPKFDELLKHYFKKIGW